MENYQFLVQPIGLPEAWVVPVLGTTDEERRNDLYLYMLDLGINYFEIQHYDKIRTNVVIDDINLN
jgi:hypothetical protein